MSDNTNKEPVIGEKFLGWRFNEANEKFLEMQADKAKIIELQARIAELEAKQRWIPVSERLPEEFTLVLTIGKDNLPVAAHVDGKNWYSSFEYSLNVTHWMPLPEPPEEYQHEPA